MADTFDVASRLAEGRPAVENLQQHVWACHLLGYQHPDLTLNPAQLRDWYGSEDGMDLAVLQSDWQALEAAVGASQDVMAVQDRALSVLSTAWQGAGAQASRDFLRGHAEASASAAAAVRTAAEAFGALRENLWRAVDAKVDAVVAVEGRTEAHRAEWLAASQTVTTGAGDRATASEMVDQAVKPFVDSGIRTDALAAMRAAMSAVTDAYQRAAAEIAAECQPMFDVPGDLGPGWSAPPARLCDDETRCEDRNPATVFAGPAAAAPTVPSAWTAPAAAGPVPTAPVPQTPMTPVSAAPEIPAGQPVPSVPPMTPLGGMGSGMPDFGGGGGLSGLGQQFADTLGGLLGGADASVPEPPDLDVPDLDDPAEPDDPEEVTEEVDEVDDEVTEPPAPDPVVAGEPEVQPCEEPEEVPAEPAPAPTVAPPPAEPLPPVDVPPAEPVAAEQTPCAIAADELPQVGDPTVSGSGAG